jgi:toluene monooxygenase system ferredoxin subunit
MRRVDGDGELSWECVAEVGELLEGDLVDLEVAGEQVLIAYPFDGEIRAFQGLCPHQEVLLADGSWDPESGRLVCAGHAWELDLRTGSSVNPAGCELYEFPVRVRDGRVEVGVPRDGQRHYRRFLEGAEEHVG